ncbi:hypothetical protein [Microbacterium testaceum]|uniref:hypothetical protein n=1 Tax=Microbacterium testaceum TaxID=2033 RepID=UPI0017865EDB|nr:hypothetical protein [Microbacterium testaceum]
MTSSTLVTYRRGGSVIAELDVEGELLPVPLPTDLRERRSLGRVEISEATGPFTEFCGSLHLVSAIGARLKVSELLIPPPAVYGHTDIRAMWLARARLHERRRAGAGGSYDWASLQARSSQEVMWKYMVSAQRSAHALVSSWPSESVRKTIVLASDRPGGRILVRQTQRTARSAFRVGGRIVPNLTVRGVAGTEPMRFRGLGAAAAELVSRVQASASLAGHDGLRDELIALLSEVSRRNFPDAPTSDPPISTWPARSAAAFWTFLAAISAFEDVGTGEQSAPLSPLWELYEAWVAESLLSKLDLELAGSTRVSASDGALATWAQDGTEVALYYQPRIPPIDSTPFQFGPESVGSVLGELIPDVVLRRTVHSRTVLVVVDAKNYGSTLDVSGLSDNASKYLWGLRNATGPWTDPPHAIGHAVVAAPLGGAAKAHPAGRAEIVRLHPSSGAIDSGLEQALQQLLNAR